MSWLPGSVVAVMPSIQHQNILHCDAEKQVEIYDSTVYRYYPSH
jgi:hypothetical protein